MEYYDSVQKTFEGAIPEILKAFEKESGYDIIYYEPDGKDRREHHFENIQVDAVSGTGGEYQPAGELLPLFEMEQGGAEVTYGITFTEAAPEKFKKELREFAEGISESEKTGLLVAVASEEHQSRMEGRGAWGLILGCGFVRFVLGLRLYLSH